MGNAFNLIVNEAGIATLNFDLKGEKVNKFSPEVLDELEAILDQAAANKSIKSLILKSGKPGIFIAGADLNTFKAAEHDPALVREMIRKGHRVFDKLQALPFPTIALIDGVCLGGGTECALACTYRIATDNPKTSIGLPETQLGIFPGWGGTQRLPRLVGLQNALPMILSGKPVDGKKASKIGLVDSYVPTKYADERAYKMAREVNGKRPGRKESFMDHLLEGNPFGRKLIFKKAREGVLKVTKGNYPAPIVALDLIQDTHSLPLKEGLKREIKQFEESIGTELAGSINLINLFFINEALKKQPEAMQAEPLKVQSVGVLGAGTMGGGIAWAFSNINLNTRMKDVNWEAVAKGYEEANKTFYKLVSKKKLQPHEANQKFHRIIGTTDYRGFKNCDLVVEAIVENLDVKRQVLKELEEVISPDTIVATNTSSLRVADISAQMRHPERFVGMHFFNPVPLMPLVEVVAGPKSSPQAIATVVDLCKKMKKTPIVVGDCAGFVVNRVFMNAANEVLKMVEEGVPMERIEEAFQEFGMPMSPFLLMDEIGIDVTYKVSKQLEQAYGERMKVSPLLEQIYQQKLLGKKGGKGFYLHAGDKPVPNKEIFKSITKKSDISKEEITQRAIFLMANEASRCLDEKVIREPGYLDMAMIMGTGFPPFRGGLLRYTQNQGIPLVVEKLRQFAKKYGDRYAPAPYLEKMNQEGRLFFQ